MKYIFLLLIILAAALQPGIAQVGIGTSTPNPSAKLDITSTNSGLLIPRMTSLQRTTIPAPALGLQVFDNDTKSFWFYTGTSWKEISIGSNGWNLTGNAGTDPSTNFLGTTDAQPLRLRVNGSWAGELHPTSFNASFGVGAGKSMTGGQANAAFGEAALTSNTDGNFNVANGYLALTANTTGIDNTAIGANALVSNSTASSNTGVGRNALFAVVTGNQNTALGKDALLANTTNDNTAVGFRSLTANTTGLNNSALGSGSLRSNLTGSNNIAIGYGAIDNSTHSAANIAIGSLALRFNEGSGSIAIGFLSMSNSTSGGNNVAIGDRSLLNDHTGSDNTAIGAGTMYNNQSGFKNVAVGSQALSDNKDGFANVAIGVESLNTNTSGSYNTAVGYQALPTASSDFNTAIGVAAMEKATQARTNTAVGYSALRENITGDFNIAIGALSGVAPGFTNLTNTIGIGNDGGFQHGASNQVVIGNASMLVIGGKVGWSVISDQRVKRNIRENVKGLDFIMKLRPVTYNISNDAITALTRSKESADFPGKRDGEKITYTGFLAQEVEQAALATGYDFSGYTKPVTTNGFYTIRYAEFVVPLVKAMQEQQTVINAQEQKISSLEKRLAALEAKK